MKQFFIILGIYINIVELAVVCNRELFIQNLREDFKANKKLSCAM
jgi:hypothetical protein